MDLKESIKHNRAIGFAIGVLTWIQFLEITKAEKERIKPIIDKAIKWLEEISFV